MVYTANWGIICDLPPVRGTRNNHWDKFFFRCTPLKTNGEKNIFLGGLVQIIFLSKNWWFVGEPTVNLPGCIMIIIFGIKYHWVSLDITEVSNSVYDFSDWISLGIEPLWKCSSLCYQPLPLHFVIWAQKWKVWNLYHSNGSMDHLSNHSWEYKDTPHYPPMPPLPANKAFRN